MSSHNLPPSLLFPLSVYRMIYPFHSFIHFFFIEPDFVCVPIMTVPLPPMLILMFRELRGEETEEEERYTWLAGSPTWQGEIEE